MGARRAIICAAIMVAVAAAAAAPTTFGASTHGASATFVVEGTLIIRVKGEVHGKVVSTPAGISCRPTPDAPSKGCKKKFKLDVKPKEIRYPLKLTITPDDGFKMVTLDLYSNEESKLDGRGAGTTRVTLSAGALKPPGTPRTIEIAWEPVEPPPTESVSG